MKVEGEVTVTVYNCRECPFVQNDNEFGYYGCSVKDVKMKNFEELPEDKVHNECPLKKLDFSITLNQ